MGLSYHYIMRRRGANRAKSIVMSRIPEDIAARKNVWIGDYRLGKAHEQFLFGGNPSGSLTEHRRQL